MIYTFFTRLQNSVKSFLHPHKEVHITLGQDIHISNDAFSDLFSSVFDAFSKQISTKVASYMFDFFFENRDKPTPIGQQLEELKNSVNSIENKIDAMFPMIKIAQISPYLANRLSFFSECQGKIDTVLQELFAVGQYTDDVSKSEEEYRILYNWYERDGNKYLINTLINFLEGGNFFSVYDTAAENIFPWEHQGYSTRKLLRLQDAGLVAQLLAVNLRYLRFVAHTTEETENIAQSLENVVKGYMKLAEDNPIVEHKEMIWQMPGPAKGLKFSGKFCNDGLYTNWPSFYHSEVIGDELVFRRVGTNGFKKMQFGRDWDDNTDLPKTATVQQMRSIFDWFKNNSKINVDKLETVLLLSNSADNVYKFETVSGNYAVVFDDQLQMISNSIFYNDYVKVKYWQIWEINPSDDYRLIYSEWNSMSGSTGSENMYWKNSAKTSKLILQGCQHGYYEVV